MHRSPRFSATIIVSLLFIALITLTWFRHDQHEPKRSLTVLAASSLRGAIRDFNDALSHSNPNLEINVEFAGTQVLLAQLRQGVACDVLLTASSQSMATALDEQLVASPVVVAMNSLEIAVSRGNPQHVGSLGSLARPSLKVVLGNANVPIGYFAHLILSRAGVHVNPVSEELDAKSVLLRLRTDQADAGIVYASDIVAAHGSLEGIVIPPSQNVRTTNVGAIASSAHSPALARRYLDRLRGPIGRSPLLRNGFNLP